MNKWIKIVGSTVFVSVITLVIMAATGIGFVIINEGSVGVKKSGTNYVQEPLQAGYHWFIPVYQTIDVITVKPRLINYSISEADKQDTELIKFEQTLKGLDKKGVPIRLGLSIEVRPTESKLPHMFATEGGFEEGFYKKVSQPNRDAVQNTLAMFEADSIMDKRAEVAETLESMLMSSYGTEKNPYFKLVNINLKDIVLPESIKERQLDVATAKQKVEQAKHEAKAVEAKAEGEANAARTKAQGIADAIAIKAKAEADANNLVSSSLTPEILRNNAIKRWDGKKSLVQSGDSQMMLNLGDIRSK